MYVFIDKYKHMIFIKYLGGHSPLFLGRIKRYFPFDTADSSFSPKKS